MDHNILDYGAVSSNEILSTVAIQRAIDACAESGGRVMIPAGTFYTGTVYLKSNVELHLCHGAKLLGSKDLDDYNEEDAYEQNWRSNNEGWNGKHLIIAHECENVAITGSGIIDGNAFAFFEELDPNTTHGYVWQKGVAGQRDKERLRPGQLVCFIECKHITVRDVTMQNATCWTCYFYGCDFVTVSGVKIYNTYYHLNTDGIDVDTSRYVTISDCVILTGDDCITFRGSGKRLKNKDRICENVSVTNCILQASACAFRIGVGTFPIKNVFVSDIVIKYAGECFCFNPEYGGQQGFGTEIDNVHFSGVSVEETGLLMSLRGLNGTPVKNISVTNVTALKAQRAAMLFSKVDGAVSNVTLRNVSATSTCDTIEQGLRAHVKRETGFASFVNIDNLTVENLTLEDGKDLEFNHEMLFHIKKCKEAKISGLNLK